MYSNIRSKTVVISSESWRRPHRVFVRTCYRSGVHELVSVCMCVTLYVVCAEKCLKHFLGIIHSWWSLWPIYCTVLWVKLLGLWRFAGLGGTWQEVLGFVPPPMLGNRMCSREVTKPRGTKRPLIYRPWTWLWPESRPSDLRTGPSGQRGDVRG